MCHVRHPGNAGRDAGDRAAAGKTKATSRAICQATQLSQTNQLSPVSVSLKVAIRWLGESGPNGTDGVVVKKLDGGYQPGERAMMKVKRLRTADCVVGGFRYERDSDKVGSLLLGLFNDAGKLDHVGFTSNISDDERPGPTKQLERMREAPGFTGKAPGGPAFGAWKEAALGNR
jgi:ATP-dependent DNA ligase